MADRLFDDDPAEWQRGVWPMAQAGVLEPMAHGSKAIRRNRQIVDAVSGKLQRLLDRFQGRAKGDKGAEIIDGDGDIEQSRLEASPFLLVQRSSRIFLDPFPSG